MMTVLVVLLIVLVAVVVAMAAGGWGRGSRVVHRRTYVRRPARRVVEERVVDDPAPADRVVEERVDPRYDV